jgi:hypothetical protein
MGGSLPDIRRRQVGGSAGLEPPYPSRRPMGNGKQARDPEVPALWRGGLGRPETALLFPFLRALRHAATAARASGERGSLLGAGATRRVGRVLGVDGRAELTGIRIRGVCRRRLYRTRAGVPTVEPAARGRLLAGRAGMRKQAVLQPGPPARQIHEGHFRAQAVRGRLALGLPRAPVTGRKVLLRRAPAAVGQFPLVGRQLRRVRAAGATRDQSAVRLRVDVRREPDRGRRGVAKDGTLAI